MSLLSQAVNLLSLLPHNPPISLPTVSILQAVAVGRLLRFLFPYLSLALIPNFSLFGGLVCCILSLASIRCDTLALACTNSVKPGTHARCYLYSLPCHASPLLTTRPFSTCIHRYFDCDGLDLKGKEISGGFGLYAPEPVCYISRPSGGAVRTRHSTARFSAKSTTTIPPHPPSRPHSTPELTTIALSSVFLCPDAWLVIRFSCEAIMY